MRAVTFDLFVRGDGTENDFDESLRRERSKADPSDCSSVFYQSQCLMFPAMDIMIVTREKSCVWVWDTYGSNTRRVIYSFGIRGS